MISRGLEGSVMYIWRLWGQELEKDDEKSSFLWGGVVRWSGLLRVIDQKRRANQTNFCLISPPGCDSPRISDGS